MDRPVNWDDLPLVLNAKEAAKVLGISQRQVYEVAKIKGFPVVYAGRRVVFPRDGLRRWLDKADQRNQAV